MKKFHVFFDENVNGILNGSLKEGCFGIWAKNKSEAINIYQNIKPKGAIFRCVKTA